jgi:hypothetical protein
LHATGDFERRCLLLLDGRSDCRGNFRQPFDRRTDVTDRSNRLLCRALNVSDLLTDFAGRFV